MKSNYRKLFMAGVFTMVMSGVYLGSGGMQDASACMMGAPGGGDYYMPQRQYMPQGQNPIGRQAQRPALTQEQARQIVTTHVQKLNPGLTVGQINDAGGFYEAEILSRENETVQLLGVDKFSGRIMLIN